MTKNIKKAALTTAISASLLMGSCGLTFAQTSAPLTPSLTPGTRPGVTAFCNRAITRLNNAVANAQNAENRWDNVGPRWQTANQRIINYLQSHNMIGQLNTYQGLVTTFTNSLNTVKTDAHNYYTALVQVQTDGNQGKCGASQGDFMAELKTTVVSRKQLATDGKIARTNFQALRSFVQSLKGSVTPPAITPTPTP